MSPFLLVLATTTLQPASASEQPKEPLVCKREPVTGSLARVRKICKTADHWHRVENQSQDASRDLQDRGLINSEAPRS